jgi:hypothetical protein
MWADDPQVPIQYDPQLNEYHLVYGNEGIILFYYCPICGGSLPKSKRGRLFTKPSAREIAKVKKKMAGGRTVDDIIALLGKPDEHYDSIPPGTDTDRKYGLKDIRQVFKYSSLAKTFDLVLQEYTDGTFDAMFSGKPKSGNK